MTIRVPLILGWALIVMATGYSALLGANLWPRASAEPPAEVDTNWIQALPAGASTWTTGLPSLEQQDIEAEIESIKAQLKIDPFQGSMFEILDLKYPVPPTSPDDFSEPTGEPLNGHEESPLPFKPDLPST